MIGTSGEVKVTDFGLARLASETQRMDLTQIGVTMGTPLYMSPEQVEGRNVDPRSDIYSLGITSFHMLAGHPPFDGDTALAVALKQVNSTPPELRAIRPDVPVELIALIKKMMEKNPDNRIQNASELLRELRKIKIDLEDGWDSLAEKLASSDQSFGDSNRPAHTAKLAVTRQLQTVMGGNIRSWWRTPFVISCLVGLSLLGAFGGFALARMSPPDNPLDIDYKPTVEIGRMKDVVEQYRAAYWGRTPEHYQAVIDYFPLAATTP
jgi:serine/threonine-protein kinase